MGKAKGTTRSLGSKHENDKFYTKPEIVQQCLSSLRNRETYLLAVEPSAGSGAFSNTLSEFFTSARTEAFDFKPEGEGITQADWLTIDKNQFTGKGKTIVVGNPPFGNKGSLAMKFIKASSFADTIAFILPKGFMKPSVKNRIPLNFHLTHEEPLPAQAFTLEGKNYAVPCVWQVWEKQEEFREVEKTQRKLSSVFEFVPKEEADFRVQRIGGKAGIASLDLNASTSSSYFLKLKEDTELQAATVVAMINSMVFPTIDHTTGPRSLPKGELVQVAEEYFLTLG